MSTSGTGNADDARRAIADFAEALSDARQAAGNPSFRDMAGRSGCISHTTLHEAMRGSRLPSWETTVEFVKACGFDPLPWRPRWEAAAAIVHPSPTRPTDRPPPAIPPSTAGTLSAADVTAPRGPEGPPRRRRSPARTVAGVAAGGVLVGALATLGWTAGRSDDAGPSPGPTPGPAEQSDTREWPQPTSSVWPESATCPLPTPSGILEVTSFHVNDHATFIDDITYPDCTPVKPGETFTKTWRFKNDGVVPWTGRSLYRVDTQGPDSCRSDARAAIPATSPGDTADISINITAPQRGGMCVGRFIMLDDADRVAFKGSRPVNFQVVLRNGAATNP